MTKFFVRLGAIAVVGFAVYGLGAPSPANAHPMTHADAANVANYVAAVRCSSEPYPCITYSVTSCFTPNPAWAGVIAQCEIWWRNNRGAPYYYWTCREDTYIFHGSDESYSSQRKEFKGCSPIG